MTNTPHMEAAIRACLAEGLSYRKAGKRYGVSHATLARKVEKRRRELAEAGLSQESETGGETPETGETPPDLPPSPPPTPQPPAELVRTMHPDLTTPQQRALQALLSGCTKSEAAHAAGVDRSSVTRWTKPTHLVQKLYTEIMADRARAVQATLHSMHPQALKVLADGMEATRTIPVKDGDPLEVSDHPTRLAAAREVLDRGGIAPKQTKVEQHSTGEVSVLLSAEQRQQKQAALRERREAIEAQLAEGEESA